MSERKREKQWDWEEKRVKEEKNGEAWCLRKNEREGNEEEWNNNLNCFVCNII